MAGRMTRGGFALPGSAMDFKTGSWRDLLAPRHQHGLAPCAGACPAGEDAQAYMAPLANGDVKSAWEVLVTANPLPAMTGRVCHHPCETACNRGQFDETMAIHAVERYLGDAALHGNWDYPGIPETTTEPAVAVVGGGPAGLACAYHLRRLGHAVTLFDALMEPGGTVATSIPPYRMPKEILQAEARRILATGITWQGHTRIGSDVGVDELRREFAAVFLAPGSQRAKPWDVAGMVPAQLHEGLALLRTWMEVGTMPSMNKVAVVGGGNTSVDVARALKRCGAEEVHLITHNGLPWDAEDPMRAIAREVRQAMEEGIVIHANCGAQRLLLRGNRVIGVALVAMRKMRGADGKLHRHGFPGTEQVLMVDEVIPAIGQTVDAAGFEALLQGQPYFAVDQHGRMMAHQGLLYAGGDARSGSSGMVSAAIGDGRRAASAIHAALSNTTMPEDQRPLVPAAALHLHYFEQSPRAEPAILPLEQRIGEAEIEQSLSARQALDEAVRCLSCGNCMICDNCWTFCPDQAVLKLDRILESDGSPYVFDMTFCKGCGICANECPTAFIRMAPEQDSAS